jgi:RNA polymerase sigma-70 factor (ECF subfamily)
MAEAGLEPQRPATDDDRLVGLAQSADPSDSRPFEELVRRYQAKVLANCRYLTGSAEDAEDLAQEVFVRVYFALRRFERRSQFSTWLFRIKVNHCLNHLRSKRTEGHRIALDDMDHDVDGALKVDASIELVLTEAATRRRVRHAIQMLPETLRVPLVMRELDEMTYEEIAQQLGIKLSAVKMRIARGRQRLRDIIAAPVETPAATPAQTPAEP